MARGGPVLIVSTFATALAACGSRPPPQAHDVRDPPCDPVTRRDVRHRTTGGFVVVEVHDELLACGGPAPPPTVTQLARIRLPATPSACPIGQLALRSWDHGHGSETLQPAFVASLGREHRAEIEQALVSFARAAEAFVVDCPAPGRADWLLVEMMPEGTHRPRVQLVVGDQLVAERERPGVTIDAPGTSASTPASSPVTAPPPPSAPPTPSPPSPSGDCSEALEPGGVRWTARLLLTGDMPGPSRVRTYAIRRDGDRATVVLHERVAKKPLDARPERWPCERSAKLQGTVVARGTALVFQLADAATPADVHEMTCTPRTLRVARADAVRVAVPSTMEGCKANEWAPTRDVKRRVLACTTDAPFWARSDALFASRDPGVEHVTLDEDDCGDPAAALRVIRADGALAPVRRASARR